MSSLKKCALAAAYSAATGTDEAVDGGTVYKTLAKLYPVGSQICKCPVDGCASSIMGTTIIDMIPHINDHHQWTREKIADWVATFEDKMLGKSKDKAESEAEKIMKDAWDKIEAKKEKVLVKRK